MVNTAKPKSGASPKGGRGGARSYKKASVDIDHLTDSLKAYVQNVGAKRAFNFFEYNSVWPNCAPRPHALAANKEFADGLLQVDPSASIVYLDIKQAATNVLLNNPESKPGTGSIEEQAGKIANVGIVLQNHLRKLAVNEGCEETFAKCMKELADDPEASGRLQEMVGVVKMAWSIPAAPDAKPKPEQPPMLRTPADTDMNEFVNSFCYPQTSEDELSTDSKGIPSFSFLPGATAKRPASKAMKTMQTATKEKKKESSRAPSDEIREQMRHGSKAERKKLYIKYGCAKCVWKPGCTPSCWKQRNMPIPK